MRNLGVVENESVPVLLLGIAAAEADLIELRPRFDPDAEASRRNLEPEFALVVERRLVERLAAVDDEPGEDVEPAGRTLRVCGAGEVRPQFEPFHQPRDIDDAFLKHRPFAGERHRLGVQALKPVANRRAAPGQEARANAVGFLADPQVEARGLELGRIDIGLRPDQLAADHGADLLPAEEAERRREQGVGHAGLGGVEDHGKGGSGRRQRRGLDGRSALLAPARAQAKAWRRGERLIVPKGGRSNFDAHLRIAAPSPNGLTARHWSPELAISAVASSLLAPNPIKRPSLVLPMGISFLPRSQ